MTQQNQFKPHTVPAWFHIPFRIGMLELAEERITDEPRDGEWWAVSTGSPASNGGVVQHGTFWALKAGREHYLARLDFVENKVIIRVHKDAKKNSKIIIYCNE